MSAVQTTGLRRLYRGHRGNPDVVALDGLSLQIEEGEVHGLLGPNGAGKTTLVKILSTVLVPTSGSATVLGHDILRETAAARRRQSAPWRTPLEERRRLTQGARAHRRCRAKYTSKYIFRNILIK